MHIPTYTHTHTHKETYILTFIHMYILTRLPILSVRIEGLQGRGLQYVQAGYLLGYR